MTPTHPVILPSRTPVNERLAACMLAIREAPSPLAPCNWEVSSCQGICHSAIPAMRPHTLFGKARRLCHFPWTRADDGNVVCAIHTTLADQDLWGTQPLDKMDAGLTYRRP